LENSSIITWLGQFAPNSIQQVSLHCNKHQWAVDEADSSWTQMNWVLIIWQHIQLRTLFFHNIVAKLKSKYSQVELTL